MKEHEGEAFTFNRHNFDFFCLLHPSPSIQKIFSVSFILHLQSRKFFWSPSSFTFNQKIFYPLSSMKIFPEAMKTRKTKTRKTKTRKTRTRKTKTRKTRTRKTRTHKTRTRKTRTRKTRTIVRQLIISLRLSLRLMSKTALPKNSYELIKVEFRNGTPARSLRSLASASRVCI